MDQIEIKGKVNTAICYARVVEEEAIEQIRRMCDYPMTEGSRIRIMPDVHAGKGCTIGTTMTIRDKAVPNVVGVDIGCGMYTVNLGRAELDFAKIDEAAHVIPSGMNVWEGRQERFDLMTLACSRELKDTKRLERSLGTLGGGNHFIEIQRGDDGFVWLMIHSGSRNFGLKVASEYHRLAKASCARGKINLSDPDLSYLTADSPQGREYLVAMNYCLDFARSNRALMVERGMQAITAVTGGVGTFEVNIHHNYAAVESHFGREVLVHRKGATSARKGQAGIIPGSMGAHSYITEGLGSDESFQSSSHGAGRRMGRNEATRRLDLRQEQQKMKGIIHGLRTKHELDEAPGAYKDIDDVMAQQQDLVKIITQLRPLAVIKG